MTINTGASVTNVRPYIVEGQPSRAYVLQLASAETIPVMKEAVVELTMGRRDLMIWVFVVEGTDEFILRTYDASVDLGRRLPRLGQEQVTPWNPSAQPISSRLSLVGDEVIPADCEGVMMTRLEARPHRTQSEVLQRRSVYSQDACPRQADSTCSPQDQTRSGAE